MALAKGLIRHGRIPPQEAATRQPLRDILHVDWIVTLLSGWLLGGAYLDAWAHNHIPQLETFFTPWHGVLYSGYLAVAAYLVFTLVRHHRAGIPWRRALPAGYGLSLAGAAIFAAGGVLDLIWHELFGIEVGVEALLSPTHLILGTGGILIVTGPLRAIWQRFPGERSLRREYALPALLSATFVLALLAYYTQYAHPFVRTLAGKHDYNLTPFFNQSLGITNILLQTAFLMGIVLLLLRRWSLPFGSLTLILTLPTILISFMEDQYLWILCAIVAGLIGDVLLHQLKPSPDRPTSLRLFAFAVPFILYSFYFLGVLISDGGIAWSVHLWTGSAVLAGVVGVLLSYLAVPLPMPAKPD